MRRKFLSGLAAIAWAPGLAAQPVPARDLWEFPLGALLEPPALATEPGSGLWNPAAAGYGSRDRWRLGAAALSSTAVQGVDAQLLGVVRGTPNGAWSLEVARAAVTGLVRTDADPQAIGDIAYQTLLVSVGASRQLLPFVRAGLAARWREGRADRAARTAVAADLGLIVHDLPWREARVAVSSFLWRPGRETEDRPAAMVAADLRLLRGPLGTLRGGVMRGAVRDGAVEQGPYLGARFGPVDATAGWVRSRARGRATGQFRTGVAMRLARYVVGVAREEGAAGLGPLYQITLSTGTP
jgi:hypothetical protein